MWVGRYVDVLHESRVQNPQKATCPDTANFPDGDWEAGMRVLAPRAFSCHVKVFNYSDDGAQIWTRDGETMGYQLKTCLKILDAAGYTGPLCVEKGASDTTEASIRDTLNYLRDLQATV